MIEFYEPRCAIYFSFRTLSNASLKDSSYHQPIFYPLKTDLGANVFIFPIEAG